MPQILSWFENKTDPTLPYELKPLLYYFDEYQTYDLIAWSRCSSKLNFTIKYLNDLYLTHPVLNESNHILIERFTPWEYPWADAYSTKLFSFIELYTGTDYYDNSSITRRGIDTNLNFGLEKFSLNLPEYEKPSEVNLTIPEFETNQTVIITWLEKEDTTRKYTKEYRKNYKVLQISETKQKVILPLLNVAYCSIVVTGTSSRLVNLIEEQIPLGCLYKHFDDLVFAVKLEIERAFPRLFLCLDAMDYSINMIGAFINYIRDNHPVIGRNYLGRYWLNPIYRTRPEYYRSCSLLYANNNYWCNGQIHNDLGKIPTFYTDVSSDADLSKIRYFLLVPHTFTCRRGRSLNNEGQYELVDIASPPLPQGNSKYSAFAFYDGLNFIPIKYYHRYYQGNPYLDIQVTNDIEHVRNLWYSIPVLETYSSLIESVTGQKSMFFAFGETAIDNPKTDGVVFDRTYNVYKINCTVEVKADCNFEITQPYFEYLFSYKHKERRTSIGTITESTLKPEQEIYDNQLINGRIQYNYFLSDTEWESDTKIYYSKNNNPVEGAMTFNYKKLTAKESIDLIDIHHLYKIYETNAGEFERELNA